ncbi:feruloyl-CoA synthase [Sagittula salina]|uniref:Feruloyl-CoA synthase n=1 Tax=Sagittula salina TaxID=2820268 RepID=A0A940MQT2_9RHOB|nr:feruloyl-CoA synthase [Sagittula salina]MBP0484125.1 feruloyl-CoA synthase [Sagittula salina]
MTVMYRAHRVRREDRVDGTIILTSGHDMGPVAAKTGDWLDLWARKAPERVFLAERRGDGWREVTYAETRHVVRRLAGGLVARGMGPGTPVVVISGNGVDHGLLALAAQYVGVPVVPLAEQYALIPEARSQLAHCVEVVTPAMVFADDGERYAAALALPLFDGVEKVVAHNAGPNMAALSDLMTSDAGVDAAAERVGPDTVAKYLMTSGSTSHPKAVITTQGMMCANQAQILDALPFLGDPEKPPRIVDWLPWNHVFGGSHNFNMMLANGGSLYIDGGKPVPALVGQSIENNRLMGATLAFNVPVGFAQMRDAMRSDAVLKERYFAELDMLFYAGASLPQDVWEDLEAMARDVRGTVPLMNSSWGLTETGPACLIQHEPTHMSGIVGVPMTGVAVKLIPGADMRCEVRVKGPNIMTGYLNDPEKTAVAFDEEGYFITGDAMRFVDPEDMTKGLKFDGRISEDFKLLTGTWVRAANLRLDLMRDLAPLAADVVICGADRPEIGVLIFPSAAARDMAVIEGDLLRSEVLRNEVAQRLRARGAHGSATQVARALVMSEPPSLGDGEITAKGNLNFRTVQTRRAALVDRLFDDAEAQVIRP